MSSWQSDILGQSSGRGHIEIKRDWHMAGPTHTGTMYSEKEEGILECKLT